MRTTTYLALLAALAPHTAATQEACGAAGGSEGCPGPSLSGALLMQRQPKPESAALVEEEASVSSEGSEERFANMMAAGEQVLQMAENVVNGTWNMTPEEKSALRMVKLNIRSMLDDAISEHDDDQDAVDEAARGVGECRTRAAAAQNGTRAYNISSRRLRERHETCREVEGSNSQNSSRACFAYDMVRKTNLSNAPACMFTSVMSVQMVSTDVVSDRQQMEECLVKIYEWSKELYFYYIACRRSANETMNTTHACDDYQREYEENYCSYVDVLRSACSEQGNCMAREQPRYERVKAHVQSNEQARKHLYTAGEHILCYFQVFNATSSAEANSTLASCKGLDVDTSRLNIRYPGAQNTTPIPCTPETKYPCTTEWLAEYQSAPWFSAAPTQPCRPCPTPPPTPPPAAA